MTGVQTCALPISGGNAGTEEITVALITHSAPGDTFWDFVRKGAEDAAKKDNVKLEYSSDPDGAKQANLVNQAVDKDVDGIAVTLAKPEAMKGAVEKAVAADIPVVAINAFPADHNSEHEAIAAVAQQAGARVAVTTHVRDGGAGAQELAQAVREACEHAAPLRPAYDLEQPLADKLEAIATGASRWAASNRPIFSLSRTFDHDTSRTSVMSRPSVAA